MHVPGLKVVMPSTPFDAKGLLLSAIDDEDPVIFIEHKALYALKGHVPEQAYRIPLGVADIKQKGKDITVVATSRMVQRALEAASALEKEGISIEVIDPRTLVPFDFDTILASVRKTGRALVVSEECRTASAAAEIAARISEEGFDFLDAPVRRLCGIDAPIPYSVPLEQASIPTVNDITREVRNILEA